MGRRSHGAPGASTPALEVLTHSGVDFTIHEYEHSARAQSFGLEAAAQLDVDPARLCKTLMVRADDGEYLVAVLPVRAHLSLKALARAAGVRGVRMADAAEAQRRTGYVVGGISPLGQTHRHRTFLDESLLDHDSVLVSGGRRGMSVEVGILDLIELTDAEAAPIALT